jgi:hypothetical protein
MAEARTGFDEFKDVLKDFRGLSLWAVGAGAAAPFITAFLDVTPPWPKSIASFTAIVELITLICAFQFFGFAGRRRLNRLMMASLFVVVLSGLTYLVLFVRFTFEIPTTKTIAAGGFSCTPEALQVYRGVCPWPSKEVLVAAQYEAPQIWQSWSIDAVRISLLSVWIVCFCALSLLVSLFIIFQRNQAAPKRAAAR